MQAGRLANVAGALLVTEEGGSPRAEDTALHAGAEDTAFRAGAEDTALRVGAEDAAWRAGAEALRALCEETLALADERSSATVSRVVPPPVGPRSPLADLAALLEATDAERLLVLWPRAGFLPEDLPAALSAWPPRDGVRIDAELDAETAEADAEAPLCAIFRREPALEQARAALSSGGRELSALDDRLDIERTTTAALGLADDRISGLTAGR